MAQTTWNFLEKLTTSDYDNCDFAFLILNQPIQCPPSMIKLLWNKAKLSALVDGGSNRWLDFIEKNRGEDLKMPDFISGDFDSIKPKTKMYFEKKQVLFISTPDQDETDFTKALRCVAEETKKKNLKIKFVIVLCENGGRFDQAMGNICTLHRTKKVIQETPVIMLSSHCVNWVLQPGQNTILVTDKFIKNSFACGIIPFCGPTKITTSGLKWNLDNQISEFGDLVSTSNTFSAKEVNITSDKVLVWTTQYCELDY